MRTIIHLSDLHFGTILEPTLAPLLTRLNELKPHLLIVSGDLTQRARDTQFGQARAYLSRLPRPQLIVPGNHDVPLYDVLRRFLAPLARFTNQITDDLSPVFVDDEIAVVGINSARSLTFKGGAINDEQLRHACSQFTNLAGNHVRIVVTHHPFDIPVGLTGVEIIRGAKTAVQEFAKHDVDLILTGHLHLVHRASASIYVPGYHATLLGAGTATSTRARGEPNSFFVFRMDAARTDGDAIVVETHSWNAARNQFLVTDTRSLPRVSDVRNR